jgi:hypothetical protein
MDRDEYAAFLVLNSKLNKLLNLLGDEVMPELDDLEAQIGRVEQAATAIVAKLQQLIDQGTVDPIRVQAAVDRLKSVADKLETAAPAEGGGEPPAGEPEQLRRR